MSVHHDRQIVTTAELEGKIAALRAEVCELKEEAKRFQQALRNSERRYVNLFTTIREGFARFQAIYDDAGNVVDLRVLDINPAGAEISGKSFEEQVGRTCTEVWPGLDSRVFAIYREADETGEPVRFDHHSALTGKWYDVTVLRVAPHELIVTFSDVTERKQAEEALRESEEKFRTLADNMSQFAWMADEKGWIFWYNKRWYEYTGTTLEEMEGWGWQKVHHPDHVRRVVEKISRCFKSGEVWEDTFPLRGENGEYRWFLSRAIPIVDGHGKVSRWFGTNTDITERKRAEEALQERVVSIRSILRAAPVGIGMVVDRVIMEANDHLCEMTGYSREELVGKSARLLYPTQEEFDKVGKIKYGQIRLTGTGAIETVWRRKDGESIDVLLSSSAIDPSDLSRGVTFASLDTTERKKAVEALRRSHDELDQRVRERTAELERKNQELQEFAFVASHDLSEPLRKIQAFGSLLAGKGADSLRQEQRDYISRMVGAATRMQELLAALLNYSRIETKGEEFRPTPLGDVVLDAISDLEVGIRDAGTQVTVEPLSIVRADPNQLRQLFQNLLGNAIKYRRPEVGPVIKVSGEEQDGNCRIFVQDNGIGFEEKYLDKIFQPFQRLHGKHEYPGTGIGLAICKKIVERHGGTITARSTPGVGSTFIVTLPVDRGGE